MNAACSARFPGLMWMKRLVLLVAALAGGCATVTPPAPAPGVPPAVSTVPTPVPEVPVAPPPAAAPEAAIVEPPAAQSLTFREFVERNDTRLLDVYVGMSRATVDKYMEANETERFKNPYKRQSLRARDGTQYEVLFYVTREPSKGKPITETQTTPLIFRNDKLVAIGRYQLKKLRRNLTN